MKELFRKFAQKTSKIIGSPYAFVVALVLVIVWAISGPIFGFSDTWQLVINTSTTIITFLTVFLIQNSQNRDSKALQLKLNELIKAVRNADDDYIDLEDLSDDQIENLRKQFQERRQKSEKVGAGKS